MGGKAVLGDAVHLSAADLDLEGPVHPAPVRPGGVVEGLVAVGLGLADVVLESAPCGRVGRPAGHTKLLDVVAHGPLPSGGDVVGLIGILLPGVEDDADGQGVQWGYVPNLWPKGVVRRLPKVPCRPLPHWVRRRLKTVK